MKVSVIVPVYNVEKYLSKCLSSLEAQSYKDFEVIIINDGSPDQSQDIIDVFVEKNHNFRTYKIENRGLGGARNFGLSKSQADFVSFLDSDDYLSPYFLEKMMTKLEEDDSDIVVCNTYDVNEKNGELSPYACTFKNNPTSLMQEKTILFNRVSAWGKVYKRSLFVEHDFAYVAREWYEDMRLTPKLYLQAEKISYVNEYLIYYLIREGSIMNNANADRCLEIIDAFDDVRNYFVKENVYDQLENEFTFLAIDHIMVSAITRVLLGKSDHKKQLLETLEEYLASYPKLKSNPYLDKLPVNRKLIYFLNKHKMYAIVKLIFKIKK